MHEYTSKLCRGLSALVISVVLLGFSGCASHENTSYRNGETPDRVFATAPPRYSVLDDWFWRSRHFDPYYSAFYAGYGVWHDPWLIWSLRTGRYSAPWHWQFDPFYSPWRVHGWGFGSSYWGGWSRFDYPFYYYDRYRYGYRTLHGVRRNGRGLDQTMSTQSSDRALELLRQSERRRVPDYGAASGGSDWDQSGVNFPMPSQQDRSILQMERPRRDTDGSYQRTPRSNQQRSVFPVDMGGMRSPSPRFDNDAARQRDEE